MNFNRQSSKVPGASHRTDQKATRGGGFRPRTSGRRHPDRTQAVVAPGRTASAELPDLAGHMMIAQPLRAALNGGNTRASQMWTWPLWKPRSQAERPAMTGTRPRRQGHAGLSSLPGAYPLVLVGSDSRRASSSSATGHFWPASCSTRPTWRAVAYRAVDHL